MKDLQNDKKVIENGRKHLKMEGDEVEAKLLDQIPKQLLKQLNEINAGRNLCEMWRIAQSERSTWLERQRVYLNNWDEFLINDSSGAFEGSSQLHLPMGFIVAKTYHARFLQALMGIDPPCNMKPRPGNPPERAYMAQELMRYTLKDWANKYRGVEHAVDRWVWDWVTTGTGALKTRWDVEFTSYIDVVEEPAEGEPMVMTDEKGEAHIIPNIIMKGVEKKITKKCFDGPLIENVMMDDLVLVGNGDDPDEMDAVMHRSLLTASDLWTQVERKVFDAKAVEAIIASGEDTPHSQTDTLKTSRDYHSGVWTQNTKTDLDRYEIVEAYVKMDVDGTGINSDLIIWFHPRSGKLVRATYLRRVIKSGERPFSFIHFYKRPGSKYGVGLIEVLYPILVELDAIHNMRIDYGILSTMPYGFYRAASSLQPETLALRPGALIPVDNPQTDVYFPNLGNRTTFGQNEEQILQNLIERLTGVSELSLGVHSGSQGATRTATGSQALVREANTNLDVHLRRLNAGWQREMSILWHMLQQRVDPGFAFRVTGDDGNHYFKTLGVEDLYYDYDIEVSANSAQSNPMVRMENAQSIMNVTASPLDIQLGIVSAGNRYEALKNYIQALGIRDVSRFISKPPDHVVSLSPEEEAQRVLNGIQVPVVPQGNHEDFITYVEQIMSSDELLGRYAPGQAQALFLQKKKHEQMMQAMQQMAAQQANSQQMQINQQQGANGTGMAGGQMNMPQGGMQ